MNWNKVAKLLRDRYIWYAVALIAITAIILYSFQDYILSGQASEIEKYDTELLLAEIQNGLLLVAVLIVAWRYKFKGGLVAVLAIGIVLLPHILVMVKEFKPGHASVYAVGTVTGIVLSWFISHRRQAEDRIGHLTDVLKAIRNINQLITHEKDRQNLLQGSCNLLAKRAGYDMSWMLLLDENRNFVAMAGAGLGENAPVFRKQLESGDYPECVNELLGQEQPFLTYNHLEKLHNGCVLASEHGSRGIFACKLKLDNKLYGVMTVCIPPAAVFDEEEQGLFIELSDDISFALASIELEEKHRQAEEALKRAEQNFRNSLDNSPLGICIVTSEGEFLYANEAILNIYGFDSIEEFYKIPYKNLYAPGSYADHQQRVEKRQRGEYVPPTYEISIVRKNGKIRHLLVSRKEILWDGSTQIQKTYQDITEHKMAERMLQESEEKFRSLAEQSPNMVFINKAGKIVYANRRCEEIMGYKREELYAPGFDFLNLIVPEDRDQIIANFRKHMGLEEIPPYDYSLITKDGRRLEVILATKLIDYVDSKAIVGIMTDITERKKTEVEIAKFKTVSDLANYGITMLDNEHFITYVNLTCAKLHGYAPIELIGQPCTILIPEDQKETVSNLFERSETTGGFTNEEVPHKRKDGTTFPALMSGVTVKDERGKPSYTTVTSIDITDRKNPQEQLMAQDRLASIGQLVSGVAHEINNPLTSVIGFSELLLQKDLPQDVKDDLNIVNSEAKRTALIVKNLLTFARKQPEGKKPVDINENIRTVLSLREHEQKVNNIQVNLNLAPDLPQVLGNNSQLQQVFINIVVNAEQAMLEAHHKGTLTITTERVGDDTVRVSCADDGPGISPENMKKLFIPFFTTKDIGKGTGLGLSISHGIITEHGGKIHAESELGKGATFIIELPIKKDASTEEKPA